MQTAPDFQPAARVARCEQGVAAHGPASGDAMRGYSARGKHSSFRSFGDLIGWIGYWAACGACRFENVNSVEDMAEARKWCPQLSNGAAANITDIEMFAALIEWRACRLESKRFRIAD
jgi:hypothetical protein